MVARAIVPVVVVEPLLVVEVVLPVVSSAVAGLTSVPSPPPHAASANRTSTEVQAALASLKVKSALHIPGLGAGDARYPEAKTWL
jgi:hypothetical protein